MVANHIIAKATSGPHDLVMKKHDDQQPMSKGPGRPEQRTSREMSRVPLHTATMPARATHWGQEEVAEWYDRLVGDEGSEYQQKVIIPGCCGCWGWRRRRR